MYNIEKAKKIIDISKRTQKIIGGILAGKGITEIAREVNCDRQLVEYYYKALDVKNGK